MYKVIRYFTDRQDNGYPYNEGDTFPRNGLTVSKERYKELSGSNNKQKTPLIKKVKDDFSQYMNPPEGAAYTKTEINRMSTADLRKMALNTGVENAETMTGTELKKYFFDVFGL